MASYAEDVARWRMERKQAQITDRVNQIGAEYAQAVRERDRAIADGDTETAEPDANNISSVVGPAAPEPMTLTLLGIGAPLIGGYLLRRRMTRA